MGSFAIVLVSPGTDLRSSWVEAYWQGVITRTLPWMLCSIGDPLYSPRGLQQLHTPGSVSYTAGSVVPAAGPQPTNQHQAPPLISSIAPSAVHGQSNCTLVIAGTGFRPGLSAVIVDKNGTFSVPTNQMVYTSSTSLTLNLWIGGTGPFNVGIILTNPDGGTSNGFSVQ